MRHTGASGNQQRFALSAGPRTHTTGFRTTQANWVCFQRVVGVGRTCAVVDGRVQPRLSRADGFFE